MILQPGMKVRCVNNDEARLRLSVGAIYEVLCINWQDGQDYIRLTIDPDENDGWLPSRFIPLPDDSETIEMFRKLVVDAKNGKLLEEV